MSNKKPVPKYVDVIASIIATIVLVGITIATIAGIVALIKWAF